MEPRPGVSAEFGAAGAGRDQLTRLVDILRPVTGRPSRAQAATVVILIALGVFFRLYGLEQKVFWHDEVYTKFFAAGYQSHDWQTTLFTGQVLDVEQLQQFQRHNPDKGIADTVRGLAQDEPQHPPGYYVLARLWVSWFGDGIATLRLLSALLGLLALPAMWWLAHELLGSRRAAWTAVVLLAVSPFSVLYAQEAREYVLWGVLTLASNAMLLRAIRRTEAGASRWALDWGAFALLTAVSLYTAFSAAAVILGQVLAICLRERMRFTRVSSSAASAMAVAALLFLPWAVVLHARLEAFQASMAWSRDIVIPRTELLALLASNLSRPVIDLWDDAQGAAWVAVGASTVLLVAATITLLRGIPWRRAVLPLCVAGVPLLLLLVPDLLYGGIRSISARYLTPTFLMGSLAVAFLTGRDAARWRTALLVGVVAAGMLSCAHNARRPAVWTKGISINLPGVAEQINRSTSPLVVGNRERHNPGNLLALSTLLRDDASIQFLAMQDPTPRLPPGFEHVYLFSPTPTYRKALESLENVSTQRLHHDLHMELWQVLPRGTPRGTEHDH